MSCASTNAEGPVGERTRGRPVPSRFPVVVVAVSVEEGEPAQLRRSRWLCDWARSKAYGRLVRLGSPGISAGRTRGAQIHSWCTQQAGSPTRSRPAILTTSVPIPTNRGRYSTAKSVGAFRLSFRLSAYSDERGHEVRRRGRRERASRTSLSVDN